MPLILSKRESHLVESMDTPAADLDRLFNTYDRFWLVNKLITGWNRIFQNHILPLTEVGGTYNLLDIGFGGGDIPQLLHNLASKYKRIFHITAIDTDIRALKYTSTKKWPDTIHFLHANTNDLVRENRTFDFIISNHLLHHLNPPEIVAMLADCERLCTGRTIHNDIERSDLAYLLFNPISRIYAGNSFISIDGLRSIRKSFTHLELKEVVQDGWTVHRMFPYRLLLMFGQ